STLHTADVTVDTAPRRRPSPIPRLLAMTGTVLVSGAFVWMAARGRPVEAMYGHWMVHNGPPAVLCLWLGSLVVGRSPGHRGGLLLIAVGAMGAMHTAMAALTDARMTAAGVAHAGQRFEAVVPATLPLDASVPMWITSWLWIPAVASLATAFLLVFPDGELPEGRRRYAAHLTIVAVLALVSALTIQTWPWSQRPVVFSEERDGPPAAALLFAVGGFLLAVAVALSVSALVGRWRDADTDQRRRMRPVAITASAFAVVAVGLWPWQWIWIPTILIALGALISSYAFAIARYRLHDLEVVVSRAVVAAILAATFTAVYLTIVVGIGHVVGRGRDSDLLPLVAVGVVAVAFDPARRRIRRWVDRLLYGHDRDAYEVLSGMAEQLRTASSTDEVLTEVAGLLLHGTGAEQIEIAAIVRGAERVVASDGRSERPDAVLAVPVTLETEPLGQIRVFARTPSDLAPGSSSLVDAVAATIGVVLRNAQLTADLREQVHALRRAGERLVHAQDVARRGLERDIHDGAQARLIALKIRLGIAARRAASLHDTQLASLIGSMSDEVDHAVSSLRDLGQGLRPSVLEGAGIAAALRSEARNLAMDVEVDDVTIHRYDPSVEAAVYFSCLEAIQNSAKHGRATAVRVRLSNGDGGLVFDVSDDGAGFDPVRTREGGGLTNLHDRLTSLGGTASIDSTVGGGTTVTGRVPVQPLVSER
ncbi:MAG: ATP-binding protein, partial [Ilumatobacteraceae bacterium]